MAAEAGATGPAKTVVVALDNNQFSMTVDPELLSESTLLRAMLPENLEDIEEGSELPVPAEKVEAEVLELALNFLKMYSEEPMTTIPKPYNKQTLGEMVQKQYADFIYSLHYKVVFKLVDAANYLGIKPLVDLCLARFGYVIKGEPIDKFKNRFRYINDFTEEEERLFRKEYLKKDNPAGGDGEATA